jgi:hypothetical protein
MARFTNSHGHEPHPPIEAHPPQDFATPRHEKAGFNRYLEQAGLLGIDLEHCQAPTRKERGFPGVLQCNETPVCVMVENKGRAQHENRIAAMALCARCRDLLLRTHSKDADGNDYCKITPIGET